MKYPLAFTIKKLVTHSTDIISSGCVAIFYRKCKHVWKKLFPDFDTDLVRVRQGFYIILNKFINFWESIRIFSIYFTFSNFLKMNVTMNFRHVFVTRFYIIRSNFPGDWTNTCTTNVASIFFHKQYFRKQKFIWILKNQ